MTQSNQTVAKIKACSRGFSFNDENLFIRKLRDAGLSDDDVLAVLEALESTCRECLDADEYCQCWNDD